MSKWSRTGNAADDRIESDRLVLLDILRCHGERPLLTADSSRGKHQCSEQRALSASEACKGGEANVQDECPHRSWTGKSHMPLRRRSRRRKLTPINVLGFIACTACIALIYRINRLRSASKPHFSSVCGHWQQKYTQLHRDTLAGLRPKRLCIATTRDEQGLYDRLTGEAPIPPLTRLISHAATRLSSPTTAARMSSLQC